MIDTWHAFDIWFKTTLKLDIALFKHLYGVHLHTDFITSNLRNEYDQFMTLVPDLLCLQLLHTEYKPQYEQ